MSGVVASLVQMDVILLLCGSHIPPVGDPMTAVANNVIVVIITTGLDGTVADAVALSSTSYNASASLSSLYIVVVRRRCCCRHRRCRYNVVVDVVVVVVQRKCIVVVVGGADMEVMQMQRFARKFALFGALSLSFCAKRYDVGSSSLRIGSEFALFLPLSLGSTPRSVPRGVPKPNKVSIVLVHCTNYGTTYRYHYAREMRSCRCRGKR